MSDNPYQAAQTTTAPKRSWRYVLPIVFGVADGLAILYGYLFLAETSGRFRFYEYLNIAGLLPLFMFSNPKTANLAILNQVLFFGGGILLWMLLGWFVGLYLDDRRKTI